MPGRRRAGFWIAGVVGVAVLAALTWALVCPGLHKGGRSSGSIVYNDGTPLPVLTQGLREGDARALVILFPRIAAQVGSARPATEAEAKELIAIITSMRTGFLQFGGYGRASSLMMVTKVLERFAHEDTPACWSEVLQPVKELFASGLDDPDLQTRIVALNEVSRFWSWYPGRTMIAIEETDLVEKKTALVAPVIRRLGDREPQARVAAVACLGNLHDDKAAATAVAYLEDRSAGSGPVRQQAWSRSPSVPCS